jgi:TonB family protein
MMLQLQKNEELAARRRKGLAVSLGLHLLLLAFFMVNPDFLSTTPRRVVRLAGEDYDRDRFEVLELYVPPDLVEPPPPPQIAEVFPPDPVGPLPEVPPALALPEEPAIPEPEPPMPPPPILGPDDLVAEGARPDAPPNPTEGVESAELAPPASAEDPGDGGNGPEGGPEDHEDVLQPPRPAGPGPVEVAENTNPNALVPPSLRSQAESIIEEVTRGQRAGANGSGDRTGELPNLTTEQPTILSDTRGYDFGPYMNQVINRIRMNWYALIPESARIGAERGRVVIVFTITESGRIEGLRAVLNSGSVPLDRAAAAAVQASNPFPELPPDFAGDHLVLQFTFLYNMTSR